MARIEIPTGRFAAALTVVFATPAIVLIGLVTAGALGAGAAILAALAMLAGLAVVLRLYLRDVVAASRYVDALAHGEEAVLPALDHPGIVPELAVAIAHLATSWEERRRELEALVSAHEAVLDRLPDPLIRLDAQRQVIRGNEAARELFGRGVAGRDLAAALRNPALLEAADRVVSGASQSEAVEFAVTPRVAAHYSARLARLPEPAEDGTVAIIALYDLTAIKRSEQLRVDFVANASHELRTPLAVLIGCLDTLEGPARDDVPARERFIAEMRRQAARMNRLVSDLLSLSRIELEEHRRPDAVIDVTRLVRSVVQTMKVRAMADRVEIELEAPNSALPVRGDEEQLTQVFQNLIDNAIKYGGKNGTVRIAARATAGDVPAEMEDGGEAVAVAVTDQGDGIPEEDLPRLTERFYRVDKARSRELGGTGLGLAIVKHVLNRHRGALRIDFDLGRGFDLHGLPAGRAGRLGSEMEFGINIAPAADSWQVVEAAEAAGFDCAWFIDSQTINADPFVAMAAAAMRTKRIHLATGMLIPSNRIAPVTANGLATLNKLAPGRIRFGTATGFTARRAMGMGSIRLAELAEYIRVVQGLLASETVTIELEGAARMVRFLNPDLGLIDVAHPIPLYISALGPRSRRLAAELGAGFVTPIGSVEGGLAAIAAIKAAWHEAGRPEDSLRVVGVGGGCVLAEGEDADSPRARAQAGPSAAIVLHDLAEQPARGSSGHALLPVIAERLAAFQPIYEFYGPPSARHLYVHLGHLMIVRREEAHLIDGPLIQAVTMTATAPELRERLRALRAAGLTQFATHVRYGQPEMVADWAEIFSGV